jgi:hypothetical protein
MTVPAWQSVTSGSTVGNAGQINQFLAAHPASFHRQGTSYANGPATSTSSVSTSGNTWIAQPFTLSSSKTTINRIELFPNLTGVGMDSTVNIETDSGGSPSGTILYSVTVPKEFQGANNYVSIPVNLSGLTASAKYHIVVIPSSNSTTNTLKLSLGVVTSNALLTSGNSGTSWGSSNGTLLFNVFSGTNGVLRNVSEDGVTVTTGAIIGTNSSPTRWIGWDYLIVSGQSISPSTLREYTGIIRSVRTLTYSGSQLITVT